METIFYVNSLLLIYTFGFFISNLGREMDAMRHHVPIGARKKQIRTIVATIVLSVVLQLNRLWIKVPVSEPTWALRAALIALAAGFVTAEIVLRKATRPYIVRRPLLAKKTDTFYDDQLNRIKMLKKKLIERTDKFISEGRDAEDCLLSANQTLYNFIAEYVVPSLRSMPTKANDLLNNFEDYAIYTEDLKSYQNPEEK